MTDLPILILAAGSSSRMRGGDKLLEEVAGEPLLRRIVRQALATGHPVHVALPVPPGPRQEALAGLSVNRLDVVAAAKGINESLTVGLKALDGAEAAMILLADLPEIETAHLQAVFAARQAHPDADVWRGATEAGKPGHPTLINRSLFAPICALEGDQGAQPVLAKAHMQLVPLPGGAARCDLDTPEDWAQWRTAQS